MMQVQEQRKLMLVFFIPGALGTTRVPVAAAGGGGRRWPAAVPSRQHAVESDGRSCQPCTFAFAPLDRLASKTKMAPLICRRERKQG